VTSSTEETTGWLDRLDIERLTYATVVVMSVLAVYSSWDELSFVRAAAVIFAPVVALAIAHYFSEVLHAHAELHRPLTRAEWLRFAVHQVQLLLAAVPPLVLLALARVTDTDVEHVTLFILGAGSLSLIALAAVAGGRAGLRGWSRFWMSMAGGLVGLVVMGMQIVLKPY
jgi:hypothetical protein